jgi:hypothetical protein
MTDNNLRSDNLKAYLPFVGIALLIVLLIQFIFIAPLRSSTNQKLAAMDVRLQKSEIMARNAQQSLQQITYLEKDKEELTNQLKTLEGRLIKSEEGRLAIVADMAAMRAQVDANKTALNDTIDWTRKSMTDLETATRAAVADASRIMPARLVGDAPAPNVVAVPEARSSLPAPARQGKPQATFEDYGLRFEMLTCTQNKNNKSVIIELLITPLDKDEIIQLYEYSKFYDQNSNEYFPEKMQLVDIIKTNSGGNYECAEKKLIKDLPAKALLHYKTEGMVEHIPAAIISFNFNNQSYSNRKEITFRNLKIDQTN